LQVAAPVGKTRAATAFIATKFGLC
jgi:hypothetical protein